MSGLNKVQIIGRLGSDPEVRFTSGNNAVANFNVATSEKRDGKEYTEWHRIVVWGKTAELCRDYLAKGSLAYFEGALRTREWEKDGQKQRTTEINVFAVQFLSPKPDGARAAPPQQQSRSPREQTKSDDPNGYGPPPLGDDEIPF